MGQVLQLPGQLVKTFPSIKMVSLTTFVLAAEYLVPVGLKCVSGFGTGGVRFFSGRSGHSGSPALGLEASIQTTGLTKASLHVVRKQTCLGGCLIF